MNYRTDVQYLPGVARISGWSPDSNPLDWSLAGIQLPAELSHVALTTILLVTASLFLIELVSLCRYPPSTVSRHTSLLLAAIGQLLDSVKLLFISVALGLCALFSASVHLVFLATLVLCRMLVGVFLAPFRIAACMLRTLSAIFKTGARSCAALGRRVRSVCIRIVLGLEAARRGVFDWTTAAYNGVAQSFLELVVRLGESAQARLRRGSVVTGVAPTANNSPTGTLKLAIRLNSSSHSFDVHAHQVSSPSSVRPPSRSFSTFASASASSHLPPNLHDSEETLCADEAELDDDSTASFSIDCSNASSIKALEDDSTSLASSTSLVPRSVAFKKPLNPAAPAFVLSPKLRIFLEHIPGMDPALRSLLLGSSLPSGSQVTQLAMALSGSPRTDGLHASTPGRIEDLDRLVDDDQPENSKKKPHGQRVPTWLRRQRKKEKMAAELAEVQSRTSVKI
ncbi:hypothetical protein C8T65DRAFT_745815 [Cerioporus squamosus]|nr:hypothetical protein C8T65DRAFT_745815 [Cerioporus squamosus]